MKYKNSFFPKKACINAIYINIFSILTSRSIEQQSIFKNIGHVTAATLWTRNDKQIIVNHLAA